MRSLILRDVEVAGRGGLDVRIESGRIAEIGERLAGPGERVDGRGGAVIPGLCDHHIHLLALAAAMESVDLSAARSPDEAAKRLADAAASRPPGAWLRAVGYHEALIGELTRSALDAALPNHPVRVQHQTGGLWVLNSRALQAVDAADAPPGLDRANGWLWREDGWLRSRLGGEGPHLGRLGRELASLGLTHLTDASVTTDLSSADILAAEKRSGVLPQKLTLMSGGPLQVPADAAFVVGPRKILLEDHALPDPGAMAGWIAEARAWGRSTAVHCVTAAELAVTLAAFEIAGRGQGDRIEHGGMIPPEAIAQIADLDLAVVTQPAFIAERGDRYLAETPAGVHPDLYRCASLLGAGVPVGASSDAPYAAPDPWRAIVAAASRRTAGGAAVGSGERVSPKVALDLWLDDPAAPGRRARRIEPGASADLVLLDAPLGDALAEPGRERVRLTMIEGRFAFDGGL